MTSILESIRYIQKRYEPEQDEDTVALRQRDYDCYRNDPFGTKWKIKQEEEKKVRNEYAERIGFVEEKVQEMVEAEDKIDPSTGLTGTQNARLDNL